MVDGASGRSTQALAPHGGLICEREVQVLVAMKEFCGQRKPAKIVLLRNAEPNLVLLREARDPRDELLGFSGLTIAGDAQEH